LASDRILNYPCNLLSALCCDLSALCSALYILCSNISPHGGYFLFAFHFCSFLSTDSWSLLYAIVILAISTSMLTLQFNQVMEAMEEVLVKKVRMAGDVVVDGLSEKMTLMHVNNAV
jgi:hypothetical protein